MLKFTSTIKWALFVGVEQEGPHQDKRTLFVVGNAPFEKIKEHINNDLSIQAIYFGAGRSLMYNPETVKAVFNNIRYGDRLGVTIESHSFDNDLMKFISKNGQGYWVIPYIWIPRDQKEYAQMNHQMEMINSLKELLAPMLQHYVMLKVEGADKIFVSSLSNNFMNSLSKGYAADKLLEQVER